MGWISKVHRFRQLIDEFKVADRHYYDWTELRAASRPWMEKDSYFIRASHRRKRENSSEDSGISVQMDRQQYWSPRSRLVSASLFGIQDPQTETNPDLGSEPEAGPHRRRRASERNAEPQPDPRTGCPGKDRRDVVPVGVGRFRTRRRSTSASASGVAVREYQTDVGPADYVLFVDKKPVGVVEAKPKVWGQKITTVEEQSSPLMRLPDSNG